MLDPNSYNIKLLYGLSKKELGLICKAHGLDTDDVYKWLHKEDKVRDGKSSRSLKRKDEKRD